MAKAMEDCDFLDEATLDRPFEFYKRAQQQEQEPIYKFGGSKNYIEIH